jgi:hypothetical protein
MRNRFIGIIGASRRIVSSHCWSFPGCDSIQRCGATLKTERIIGQSLQDEDAHGEPEPVRILEQKAPCWPPGEIQIGSTARCF